MITLFARIALKENVGRLKSLSNTAYIIIITMYFQSIYTSIENSGSVLIVSSLLVHCDFINTYKLKN